MARRAEHGLRRKSLIPIDARSIRRFLRVLEDGWTPHKAARVTGIKYDRWMRERKKNSHFSRRWERAVAEGVTTLEDAAQRRAVKGVLKPIVSNGRIITHVRQYSDGLLKTALEARSKTYAPANPGDSSFEESFLGAAETLQSALTDLFAKLEVTGIQEGDPGNHPSPQR